MTSDEDLTKDPYYRSTISSLAEGEEVLWSGKPELKCYQNKIRHEYVQAFIFMQAIILPGVILSLIWFPITEAKKFIVQFTVVDLVSSLMIAGFISSPRKTPAEHYTITSRNVIYAFFNQGNIVVRKMEWKHIKNVRVRQEPGGLQTIIINPFFWTGHNVCIFRCRSQGYEVLAIIATYRLDLHDDRWFS